MIYTASQIVTDALNLADLQNTSIPTARENRLNINVALADVYQEAINAGEKYWFEELQVDGNSTLPDDFYQLYDIKDSHGNRIERRQRNSFKTDRWYDIRGNILYLNNIEDTVTLEYFPEPPYLDPEETGDVELDFPNHIFYHILTLRLAEYYKIKQSGDISGIEMLLEQAWDTYRNILTRDLDQPKVITNVYNRRIY